MIARPNSMLLFAILGFGIFTLWVPGRWALTIFELAILVLAAVRVSAGCEACARHARATRLRWVVPGLMVAATVWIGVQILAGWTVDLAAHRGGMAPLGDLQLCGRPCH